MQRAEGFVQQGGEKVTTSGLQSLTEVQESYPLATVTVYLTGTLTLATIFSDNSSTPLSNPFTANANGFWFFYAANGRYDVAFSGAGIVPWTLGDILLADPSGGGTTVSSVTAGNAGVIVSPNTGAVIVSNAWGTLPSGTQTQQLQIQPNTGNNTTLQFASKPEPVCTDYVNFSTSGLYQTPPDNLSPSARTITFTPVPLGVNGADTNHYIGIFNNSGALQEIVLINGGTAVSGASAGNVTVASIAGTYATGSYKVGSSTAGIQEAINSLGNNPGTVIVPNGQYSVSSPITIQVSNQGIAGTGLGSVLNKTSATGNLIQIQPVSGNIDFNFVRDIFIQSANGVTPTAGNIITVAPNANIGSLDNITINNCFNGIVFNGGGNWTGGNITIIVYVTGSMALSLNGGVWYNLQAVQNGTGGTGIFVDNCDGLQIAGLFIEGRFTYGIFFQPDNSLSQHCFDVNITDFIIDLFLTTGLYLSGTGPITTMIFTNGHVANQTPDASNDHAVKLNGACHNLIFNTMRVFNNRLRGFSLESGATNCNHITISGCSVLSNSLGSSGTYSGIAIDTGCADSIISGNTVGVYPGSSPSHKYAVEINTSLINTAVTTNFLLAAEQVTGATLFPGSPVNSITTGNIA